MKHHTISTLLATFFLAILVIGPAALQARDHGCSTTLTAGDWAFTDTGSIVGLGPSGAIAPFGAIGAFTLDAAGNVVGEQTNSVGGNIAHLTFAGPYTVNADCTGSANLDVFDSLGNKVRTSGFDLVFDDDVQEMRAIFTSIVLPNGTPLSSVITLEAKRLFSKNGR